MKRILSFIFAFIVLASVTISAFADEIEETLPDDSGEDVVIYYDESDLTSDLVLTDVVLLSSVAPVKPSSTSGLKAVLLNLIGDYDPIIAEYRYQNTSTSNYSYLREVQIDYVWLASFFMLALIIYCLFRLGGALIGG